MLARMSRPPQDGAGSRQVAGAHPTWRLAVLGGLILGALGVILSLDPWRQDPAYHLFADRRAWLGVANFADVASNLPFLAVGLWGLRVAWTPGIIQDPGS